jgi:hypothetical protein
VPEEGSLNTLADNISKKFFGVVNFLRRKADTSRLLHSDIHLDSDFSGFGLFELECLFGAIPKEDWAIILAKMPPDVAKKVKKQIKNLGVFE